MRNQREAIRFAIPLLALALGLQACGGDGSDLDYSAPVPASAPLTGKADGTDLADRDCNVVLRDVQRAPGPTGYEVDCSTGYCWFVWEGHVDVSDEAVDSGAEPFVLFSAGSDGWWEVGSEPTGGAAEGYQRFSFRMAEHTLSPGMGSSMVRASIELIPFIRLDGARHFDHNRVTGELENYVLEYENDFSVYDDPSACGPALESVAYLEMRAGWIEEQRGALVAGGSIHLDYDIERLPECRAEVDGAPVWDVVAHARFYPGEQELSRTVRAYEDGEREASSGGYSEPARLPIPSDAEWVELWFEGFNNAGESCRTWDSNLGRNYGFEILSSPPSSVGWAGDLGHGFNRECVHVPGLEEPMSIGSWELQRACLFIEGDVWIPGLTDEDGPAEYVLAQVEYEIDGGGAERSWLGFVDRVGNNYRYRWTLPRTWLSMNDWSVIEWSFRFSTNGIDWYRVGQDEGPDGGEPRTIENSP